LLFVFKFRKINNLQYVSKSVNFDNKKTRIYTVLKILKVMSLSRYTETLFLSLCLLTKHKYNNCLQKCQLW